MSSDASTIEEQNETFLEFQSYDFDNDSEFSTRVLPLLSKLESNGIGADAQDLLLKAKARHFSRIKDISIDVSAYNTWLSSHPAPPSTITLTSETEATATADEHTSTTTPIVHTFIASSTTTEGQTPVAPLPLQELAKLIAQGRVDEIPVLHVEEKLHDAPEKTDITNPVLKPWERIQTQS